ncbi:MAG: molybdenum cofactor guanylyltransferase [Candidatus Hodarchaeales archaeon]
MRTESDKIAIILLAGGKSTRFRQLTGENAVNDKLLIDVNGRTLIEHVSIELRALGDVFIITAGENRYRTYSTLLNNVEKNNRVIVLVENRKTAIGPIGGIYDALDHCKSYMTKIILPADLPHVNKAVIASLIDIAQENNDTDLISLIHPNGQVEHLVIATTGNNLLDITGKIINKKIHRVSSLIRAVSSKFFVNTVHLTGNNVFVDVDYSASVQPSIALKKINPVVASKKVSFNKEDDPSDLYTEHLRELSENNLTKAIELLKREAEAYTSKGLLSLALHCLLDASKISTDTSLESRIGSLKDKLRD